jgi:hypothetical protein
VCHFGAVVTFRVHTTFGIIQFLFHTENALYVYAPHKLGVRKSGGMAPGTLNLGVGRS